MIDQTRDMETTAGAQATEPMQAALRYGAIACDRIAAANKRLKEYVIREPARALGIALGVGVFIGLLIKRR
jgi:ElaB/YqjD/DUF883 family membrane-anchored ribosome-binding protein